MSSLQTLVNAADEAALLRAVDRLCASRQWDELVDLARRCLAAVELGKQLWPVAMHIDYRLALEAPAPHAAAVLRPGAARFALGPLTEVAAGSHDWAALAPHIPDLASAATVAQERVIRGEDLTDVADAADAEVPLRLADWEPRYALPRYRDREAVFPEPDAAARTLGPAQVLRPASPAAAGHNGRDTAGEEALRELVEVWSTQSAGRIDATTVAGSATEALGHLLATQGTKPLAAMQQLPPAEAIAILQWAGASGGAYGRRRGGARGRFAAWWAATALCGLDWPVEPDELGAAVGELQWYRWTRTDSSLGWSLRLAIHDPIDGLAWAIEATDQRDEG